MQALELTPRAESLITRLEKLLATGASLEAVARSMDLRQTTLEQLLQRKPLSEQSMAWDDENTAFDKLENWLAFQYDERAENILTRLESRLASGLTRERLANEAGIRLESLEYLLKRQQGSESADSYWNRDPNREAPAHALTQLEIWLSDEEIQAGTAPAGLAPTPIYQTIHKYLSLAHAGKRLVALTGDVGIGKSAAARAYAAAHPKTTRAPGVVYVEFTELDTKPLAALQRIVKALPARPAEAPRQEHVLLDYVASCFVHGDLLILDECNHLAGRKGSEGHALGFVRDLFERGRAGLAMLGNPDLRARVWGEQQGFPALASRTMHFSLDHITEADVDIWMQWKGLTGKALRKACVKIAARPGQHGGLRALERLVETHLAVLPGHAMDAASLERIAHAMGRL